MKKQLLFLLFTVIFFNLFSNERGLTSNIYKNPENGKLISTKIYEGRPKLEKISKKTKKLNSRDLNLVQQIETKTSLQAGDYLGFKFNQGEIALLNKETNQNYLCETALNAIDKSPKWMRADLERTLRDLDEEYQIKWSNLILAVNHPIVDEVAYSIAHTSTLFLSSFYAYPEMFQQNAELMYQIDEELSYVEILDYETPFSSEEYYSTTKYLKKDENGDDVYVEVPREIYYDYIVMPKITDDMPAFINPNLVESNSSHDNNITGPEDGRFWREYLYYHNDEGYPKLRFALIDCDYAFDGTMSTNNAVGAGSNWIAQSLEFTSNNERPHQPVRIYKKHIGRCGEHADIRAAMLRIALIPATSILTISCDHTWNEFWDERWIHLDGNSVDNPLMYENGWGKTHGSVFEIQSDGLLNSVSDRYSEGSASIEINIVDSLGTPVDGVEVTLKIINGSYRFDNYGTTDDDGQVKFIVGDERDYYFSFISPIGYQYIEELVMNAQAGEEYVFTVELEGEKPKLPFTEIVTPNDDTEDYFVNFEYEIGNQISRGETLMDDIHCVPGTPNHYNVSDKPSQLSFFMTDETNANLYINEDEFQCFNYQNSTETNETSFEIPEGENWFTFFDNSKNLSNPKPINVTASVYVAEEITNNSLVNITVKEAGSGNPVENANINFGFVEYSTDENGFVSAEVPQSMYQIDFSHANYHRKSIYDFIVGESPIDLEIFLFEEQYAPSNLVAEINGSEINLTWNAPESEKIFNNRVFQSYNLYRAKKENQVYDEWELISSDLSETSYTDSEWNSLEDGSYKYSIEAVYEEETTSHMVYSNEIYKNMTVACNISITTNSDDSPEDAKLILTNYDGNPLHKYDFILDSSGEINIENCWKGSYSLSITKDFFDTYTDSLEITENTDLDIELIETLETPKDLSVINYNLCWSNVTANRNFLHFNIYVDSFDEPLLTTQDTTYSLEENSGEHIAGVSAEFSTGESEIIKMSYVNGISLNDHLIGYYKFDGDVIDYSSNEYDGEITDIMEYVDDSVYGQAADFDGDTGTVNTGITNELNSVKEFSMGCWLKIQTWEGWNGILNKGGKTCLQLGSSEGALYPIIRNPDNNYGVKWGAIETGVWNHIVMTFNGNKIGNSNRLKLYINGDEVEMNYNGTIPETTITIDEPLFINQSLDGIYDEVVVYDREISAKEISFIYEGNNPTDIDDFDLPTDIVSMINYPNPFKMSNSSRNTETNILFSIPQDDHVNISVYNIKGQHVKTITNQNFLKGKHIVKWNGRNNSKQKVASGVYFYKLKTQNHTKIRKMLLIK